MLYDDEYRILTAADRRQLMKDAGMEGEVMHVTKGKVAVMSPKGSIRFLPRGTAKSEVALLNERYRRREKPAPRIVPRRTKAKSVSQAGYHAAWIKPKGSELELLFRRFTNKQDAIARVKKARREGAIAGLVETVPEHPTTDPKIVFEFGGYYEAQGRFHRQRSHRQNPDTDQDLERAEAEMRAAHETMTRLEESGKGTKNNAEYQRAQTAFREAEQVVSLAQARARALRKKKRTMR